ncbi:hypothetical protein NW767_007910 [Fusarium falciforme]|nr:hypothetical protein NW767_007910 [Fusarium falciforme]
MALGRLNSTVDPTAGSSIDESEDLISTIFLAAKGLADQGKNYFIPTTLFELVQRQMSPEHVTILLSFVDLPNRNIISSRLRTEHVQAEYPVNIVDMTDHPDKKRLGKMIEEFTSLNVEERPRGGGSEPGSDQPEA